MTAQIHDLAALRRKLEASRGIARPPQPVYADEALDARPRGSFGAGFLIAAPVALGLWAAIGAAIAWFAP
jgi:hypothetical protein